jgi:uncharacterized protein (DUF697 family)
MGGMAASTATRALGSTITWTKDALASALQRIFDEAAKIGERTEKRVLDAALALDIPVQRVEALGLLPLETRDDIAERVSKGHATLAAVSCGTAGAIPVAGFALEMAALAELNVVQVDHIARSYGFEIGRPPKGISEKLPLGGSRAVLLLPILAALEVRALERDGKMHSLADALRGTIERSEWQALGGRIAAECALSLLRRAAIGEALGSVIPIAGGAVAAWSSYKFTEAVGRESIRYFRDLATGQVVVRGRLSS